MKETEPRAYRIDIFRCQGNLFSSQLLVPCCGIENRIRKLVLLCIFLGKVPQITPVIS